MNKVTLVGCVVADLTFHDDQRYAIGDIKVVREGVPDKFDTFPIVFGNSKFDFAKQYIRGGQKLAILGHLVKWRGESVVVVEADSTDWLKNITKED